MGIAIFQNKKILPSLYSRSGQGVLEYLLILVVTVGLILLLSKNFLKNFGDYTHNFMGTYVQCLLETGELPQIGVGGSGSSAGSNKSECSAQFNQKNAGSLGGDSGTSGGSKDGSDSGGEGKDGSSSESASESSNGGKGRSRRSSTFAGSASRNNPFFRPRGFRGGGAEGSGAGAGKTVEISVGEGGGSDNGFYSYNNASVRGRGRQIRYIAITGQMSDEIKKKTDQAQKGGKSVVKTESSSGGVAPKKIAVKIPDSNQRKMLEKDEEITFSIGNIFRILLIAAIIIIIVVLIGGQVLQLSKSWEK